MPRTKVDYILFDQLRHASSVRDVAREVASELYRRHPARFRQEARRATWLGERGEHADYRVARGLYANVDKWDRNVLVERCEGLVQAMGLCGDSFKIVQFHT